MPSRKKRAKTAKSNNIRKVTNVPGNLATSKPEQDAVPLSESMPGTMPPTERMQQVIAQSMHFSGPLPHPEVFRLYRDIIPDAPERMLTVFEKDSDRARELPLMALQAQKDDNRRAHWMAWSLVTFAFILSFVFASMDKDGLAGIVIGTTLVAIVTGFLKSRHHDDAGSSRDKRPKDDDE